MKAKYNLAQTDLVSVDTVDPVIGKELQRNAIIAVIASSILILLYVAFRFSVMGGWAAGVTATMALIHDILILLSVYLIAHFTINSAFIAAALTILGYSMNDTIIVYDRIRENERLLRKVPIEELVNTSITQTLSRTINTVLTVVITITTLYIFGVLYNVEAIKEFTLPLVIGIVSGSYSSIFIASSLYVVWMNRKNNKEKAARA
jgi:preprotein translocase subunit SecF